MSDYTVVRVDDVPNAVPQDKPGEMKGLTRELGGDQLSCTYRKLPPGAGAMMGDRSVGHSHKTQDEIYYVTAGTMTMKLGDDEVELGPRTAVRVPPETIRSYANLGDEDAELIIFSTRVEDAMAESEFHQDFWPA